MIDRRLVDIKEASPSYTAAIKCALSVRLHGNFLLTPVACRSGLPLRARRLILAPYRAASLQYPSLCNAIRCETETFIQMLLMVDNIKYYPIFI